MVFGGAMICGAAKALARRIPPVDALIRQRDALLDHRDALLVELDKTRRQFQAARAASDALISHRDALIDERDKIRDEFLAIKAGLERPHFANDYGMHVRGLMASHPIDEAMSLAVGGSYDEVGREEVAILRKFGLSEGMAIIDLGCGSGRLAKHLGLTFQTLEYLGIDVVQELLDYAATKSPPHFRFIMNHELCIPAPTDSTDFVVAFSVFTHLLHEETYLYLQDAKRVLRSGGSIVLSFLESIHGWQIFEEMLKHRSASNKGHLNMFAERSQIKAWAMHLGLQVVGFDCGPGHDAQGQSIAVLTKPT